MLSYVLFSVIVILVIVVVIQLVLYIQIHKKNHLMTEAINDLVGYREAAQLEDAKKVSSESERMEMEDRDLFFRLDQQMEDGRLYRNPNLNRDMLCQLIGVDKNRLGRIITRYSGANNSTTYINRKRIQHAIELMREHPDWTKMNIAIECGMSNTSTFNRIFLQTYGMTPTEYLKQNEAKS